MSTVVPVDLTAAEFGEPDVSFVVALKAQPEQWAAIPDLVRVVVSQGDIIDEGAPAVLRGLAAKLA